MRKIEQQVVGRRIEFLFSPDYQTRYSRNTVVVCAECGVWSADWEDRRRAKRFRIIACMLPVIGDSPLNNQVVRVVDQSRPSKI